MYNEVFDILKGQPDSDIIKLRLLKIKRRIYKIFNLRN